MSEILENGMVLGAEDDWDRRELEAELRRMKIDDAAREIRKTLKVGDILAAIAEAPTELQDYLFMCWQEMDNPDLSATVHDMVDYYIDQLAIGEVDARS